MSKGIPVYVVGKDEIPAMGKMELVATAPNLPDNAPVSPKVMVETLLIGESQILGLTKDDFDVAVLSYMPNSMYCLQLYKMVS